MTESSSNLIRQLTEAICCKQQRFAIAASREVADRRIEALNAAVAESLAFRDMEGAKRYMALYLSANRGGKS